LRGPRGVIGVLGVDNRINKEPFGENHLALMTRIAAYTAIALENARLFANTEIERRKLNAILTKVVDGIIVVDHNQNMVLMNPTAREAFGVSSRYLAGSPIKDLVASTDLLEILNQNENMYPFQREVELEDGRVFNVQATVIPEVGIALTMQDMTQIKELDRIKSDFVSTVSHDLRSPLTAILGYVELLDRVGPLTDMQREFVERVHVSVQSITTLINELLDLSRIEAGFDTQKEFFSIEAIIDATVEELRESADTKNQVITQEVPPDLPPIFASPSRIQQVLANLVGNAIKYTQETGEVKIIARTEADQLILQICDDGPGILPAEQPFVFDRFFRASNVGETDGTGLGLAIVKSIVENHHGRTWVESVPGQGSTFTVVLPLLPPNETPPLSEIQSKNQA
jgi:two-component system NtrC family sensor kinase